MAVLLVLVATMVSMMVV